MGQGVLTTMPMLVAEELDALQLAAMAARVVTGDLFGLAKVMPAGTKIHTQRIKTARDRVPCLQNISAAVEAASVPRKYHASIEQCKPRARRAPSSSSRERVTRRAPLAPFPR